MASDIPDDLATYQVRWFDCKGNYTEQFLPDFPTSQDVPPGAVRMDVALPIPNAEVDFHLDAVLKASGSALRHFSMAKTLQDMRRAMRAAIIGKRPD